MYLFFDTETTGLPRSWNAPIEFVANWPRVVEIAWLTFDEDGKEKGKKSFIIKPDGFKIPDEAAMIHGITTDLAAQSGKDLYEVLDLFSDDVLNSELLVGHNIYFDERVIGAEFIRAKKTNVLEGKRKLCTMTSSAEFCKLPGNYGYKNPKLVELYEILFGKNLKEVMERLWMLRFARNVFLS